MPRSHEFSVLAEERGIVDGEEHAHRRLVDGDRRKGLRILAVGDRVADLEAVNAHNSADVTALYAIHIGLSESVEDHQLLDLMLLHNVIPLAEADLLACLELTSCQFTHGDTSDVRGIFK